MNVDEKLKTVEHNILVIIYLFLLAWLCCFLHVGQHIAISILQVDIGVTITNNLYLAG